MAEETLTAQEEQHVRQAIQDYESRPQVEGGPKELFCQHWPVVKEVLDFLKDFLPPPLPGLVGKLIRVGDMVHSRLCRAA